jgi:hypothetical protein
VAPLATTSTFLKVIIFRHHRRTIGGRACGKSADHRTIGNRVTVSQRGAGGNLAN